MFRIHVFMVTALLLMLLWNNCIFCDSTTAEQFMCHLSSYNVCPSTNTEGKWSCKLDYCCVVFEVQFFLSWAKDSTREISSNILFFIVSVHYFSVSVGASCSEVNSKSYSELFRVHSWMLNTVHADYQCF